MISFVCSMPVNREKDFKEIMHLNDHILAQEPLPRGS